MDYKRIYLELVKKRIQYPAKYEYEYTENHHIKPVSIFPEDKKNKNNIVNLSAREHFIAHALLVKYYKQKGESENYFKMLYAFDAMSKLWGSNRTDELRYKCGNRKSYLYQVWREELSKYIKVTGCFTGENSSSFNKRTIYNEELKQIKHIDKNEPLPEGWKYGNGPWITHVGSSNKVWVYNINTNKSIYIKKDTLNTFLENNPEYKRGISPTSKSHIQQYNPSKGKVWISNIELRESKYYPKEQGLPAGWVYGRTSDWEKYIEQYNDSKGKSEFYYFVNYEEDIKNNHLPEIRKYHHVRKPKSENKKIQQCLLSKFEEKESKINLLKEYYQVYKVDGFKGVVNKFNYKYTSTALIRAFHKYLPEFIPQNGKRRKSRKI